MGRGPRGAADGCEAGRGPATKAAGRCSRPDVRGVGSLGKAGLFSRRRPPPAADWGGLRARCGWGDHRLGQRGSGPPGTRPGASVGEASHRRRPATPPQQSHRSSPEVSTRKTRGGGACPASAHPTCASAAPGGVSSHPGPVAAGSTAAAAARRADRTGHHAAL